jgi:hypothetical protein
VSTKSGQHPSPASLSLGPLAVLARLAAELLVVRPLMQMESPWVLGRVRALEVAEAAFLMGLFLGVAFVCFVFFTLSGGKDLSLHFLIAISAFLAGIPLRRRSAGLASTAIGVSLATLLALIASSSFASPEIRAFGPPHPVLVLIVLAIAILGVLAAFRVVRPAVRRPRWNRMGLW